MAYPISKWIIPFIYKPWIRKIRGIGNIPKNTSFIIAANHSSYFDIFLPPILIGPGANKKIHAFVNSHYWNIFLARIFLELWESIPVYVGKENNSKEKNKLSFERALKYLRKNELVMIFPEGKRSQTGKLQRAYTGVARLALKAKVPVLPCGIIDANKVLPVGKAFPRFARCKVKIGKPVYFDRYYNKKPDQKILEEATRSIMKEIAKLIGQEYSY